MVDAQIQDALLKQLDAMPLGQQRRVLDYAKSLASEKSSLPPAIPGSEWVKFAGTISDEDAQQMMQAIEEGCERIDPDGWKITL